MVTAAVSQLSIAELVALAYGTRARQVDLQHIQSSGDRSMANAKLLAEVSRAVDEVDVALIERARETPPVGWFIFDMIKATHNGSVQNLSQRLKEILPPR